MSKAKRAVALILCVGMVLVLFTSSAYLAHEADHLCAGDHCEICERVERVRVMLHRFALLFLALFLAVCAVLPPHRSLLSVERPELYVPCTLVSWKVRLNN